MRIVMENGVSLSLEGENAPERISHLVHSKFRAKKTLGFINSTTKRWNIMHDHLRYKY